MDLVVIFQRDYSENFNGICQLNLLITFYRLQKDPCVMCAKNTSVKCKDKGR